MSFRDFKYTSHISTEGWEYYPPISSLRGICTLSQTSNPSTQLNNDDLNTNNFLPFIIDIPQLQSNGIIVLQATGQINETQFDRPEASPIQANDGALSTQYTDFYAFLSELLTHIATLKLGFFSHIDLCTTQFFHPHLPEAAITLQQREHRDNPIDRNDATKNTILLSLGTQYGLTAQRSYHSGLLTQLQEHNIQILPNYDTFHGGYLCDYLSANFDINSAQIICAPYYLLPPLFFRFEHQQQQQQQQQQQGEQFEKDEAEHAQTRKHVSPDHILIQTLLASNQTQQKDEQQSQQQQQQQQQVDFTLDPDAPPDIEQQTYIDISQVQAIVATAHHHHRFSVSSRDSSRAGGSHSSQLDHTSSVHSLLTHVEDHPYVLRYLTQHIDQIGEDYELIHAWWALQKQLLSRVIIELFTAYNTPFIKQQQGTLSPQEIQQDEQAFSFSF